MLGRNTIINQKKLQIHISIKMLVLNCGIDVSPFWPASLCKVFDPSVIKSDIPALGPSISVNCTDTLLRF